MWFCSVRYFLPGSKSLVQFLSPGQMKKPASEQRAFTLATIVPGDGRPATETKLATSLSGFFPPNNQGETDQASSQQSECAWLGNGEVCCTHIQVSHSRKLLAPGNVKGRLDDRAGKFLSIAKAPGDIAFQCVKPCTLPIGAHIGRPCSGPRYRSGESSREQRGTGQSIFRAAGYREGADCGNSSASRQAAGSQDARRKPH